MATIRNRSIEIVPVKTRRQWQSFHGLPQRLRGADSRWIQPLRLQVRQAWAPRQPYFRHASAAAWIAIEADRVVGRISAQVDSLDQQLGRAGRGQFGQLEAVDDAEVFQRLTDIAGGWLKAHGMTDMLGPFDLSINQQCGVLVDGFEHAPMMMMNHNPEYYPSRLEQAGFEPAADTHRAWNRPVSSRRQRCWPIEALPTVDSRRASLDCWSACRVDWKSARSPAVS